MCEEYSYYNLDSKHLQYAGTGTDINRADGGKLKGKDAYRQTHGYVMEFRLLLIPVGKFILFISLIQTF